jgi:hypothetical protein
VIADVHGALVAHVRIAGHRDGTGESLIGGTDDPQIKLVIRLAGLPAERRYCEIVGDCPADRDPSHSAHDDNERAWALGQEVYPDDGHKASELLTASRGVAETMVEEEWVRIQRVALALYDSPDNMLRATQFRELMDS